ncbi:MAG: mechanosensitive ion channel family protein [Candidatus Gracilibacteria bacterium]|nr:mechanosensitive ion channel family protein [Candidatus Gracilibacteria bacterium]
MATVADHAETVGSGSAGGITEFLTRAWEMFPYFIVAVIVMFFSVFFAKVARAMAKKTLMKSGGHEGASSIVGKSAYALSIVLGATISLKILGIDISFITGAVVFGLGFAMKDIIENYISGIMILLQQPFKIGDIVKAGSVTGRVEEIEARTTFIRVFDGQRVVVPNSQMLSETLTNYSTYPERRITILVGVAYDTDLNKAVEAVLGLLTADKNVLNKPKPAVLVSAFEDSSIKLTIRFWVDSTLTNFLKKQSAITLQIQELFQKEGISIPFPIVALDTDQQKVTPKAPASLPA